MHGHAPGEADARGPLALGQGTLENLGVTGMRVLVTGHRGYIGSPLVERLKTAGHEVVGVDTELYEDCTFGLNKDTEARTINPDIRDLHPRDLDDIPAI